MVNRRTLRIKAIQTLYAYKTCQLANFQVAQDLIANDFSKEKHWHQDFVPEVLDSKSKAGQEFFRLHFEGNQVDHQVINDAEVLVSVKNAIRFYQDQNTRDLKRLRKEMFSEIEKTEDLHLLILLLITELAKVNLSLFQEKKSLSDILGAEMSGSAFLFENKVIQKIINDDELKQRILRKGLSWKDDEDKLLDWFKKIIRKSEVFQTYVKSKNHSYEQDWDFTDDVLRNVIFKSDSINASFEDKNLNWEENKVIVRSLALKSLKSVKEEEMGLELAEISYNWDEDRAFLEELFNRSVEEDVHFEQLIEEKSLNWNIERITLTDKLVIKAALAEMIYFPGIPVKVTINEFIEISKIYSTPKSKKFVNGLLDVLSQELIKEGIVKKSGRGLIDSK
ncbi:MAG: transcription antitermination factor NusB [Cyclobacteriaceae bacterium]|nr:transcription antitermination factor NusB [Cyclobacteriaceae bacterium]